MSDFLVDNRSICTACNTKVADKDCLTCNTCECLYHAVCSVSDKDTKLCGKSFLDTFKTNSNSRPNFSWQCDSCKTQTETDNVATLKNMFLRLERSHTTQIKQLTDLVTALSAKVTELSTPKEPGAGTVWGDQNRVTKVRSSFIAKPDVHGKKVEPNDVRKIATDKGIPVDSVIEADNGDLFVNLPDEESRNEISQLLGQSHEDNEMVMLTAKSPTISIRDITVRDMRNDDNEDLTTSQIKVDLCKQNKAIDYLVKKGSKLDVVYCKKPPEGKKFYTVVARVSPDIRDVVGKMKMKIHFGTSVHGVVDRFHIRRCNLCQAFGHYANKCSPDTAVVCGYCTEGHKSDDCPHKAKDHTHHTCNNCKVADLPATGHAAFWQKCPAYLTAQQKLAKTISYDYKSSN